MPDRHPDLLYRHVLSPSPELDWRRLRASVSPGRWQRMAELALVVSRYSGGYGLPLANEGEFALIKWLANFGSAEQATARLDASKNLIEAANMLAVMPGDQDRYEGYRAELQRCLDLEKWWRAGPWTVAALDWLCYDLLAGQPPQVGAPAVEAEDPAGAQMALLLPSPSTPAAPSTTSPKQPKRDQVLQRTIARLRAAGGLSAAADRTVGELANACGASERTTRRALKRLREEATQAEPVSHK
jgi:hypothetical protein